MTDDLIDFMLACGHQVPPEGTICSAEEHSRTMQDEGRYGWENGDADKFGLLPGQEEPPATFKTFYWTKSGAPCYSWSCQYCAGENVEMDLWLGDQGDYPTDAAGTPVAPELCDQPLTM